MSRYYAVNDRPVALLDTEDGGLAAYGLDLPTGLLVRDPALFERVSRGGDVDSLDPGAFLTLCAQHLLAASLPWESTGDGEIPYAYGPWRVRVNDFPGEALYSVLYDGERAIDLEDWPEPWSRP